MYECGLGLGDSIVCGDIMCVVCSVSHLEYTIHCNSCKNSIFLIDLCEIVHIFIIDYGIKNCNECTRLETFSLLL